MAARRSGRQAEAEAPNPPAGGDVAADPPRTGIQSISRAFAILEEVARDRDGVSLSVLSKRVGLHNSTTFHLVKTMVTLGYVRQIEGSKRYRVGRPLFALASAALDEIEMASIATPILENLAQQSGESSHFAVRMRDRAMVLARIAGPGAFQFTDRAGVVRPPHATAIGKVLLAALDDAHLEDFLAHAELSRSTENTITDPDMLRLEIQEVRRNHVAYDDCEFNIDVRCVAVPVRDFTGHVAGAIGISGPVWRMTIQAFQQHMPVVSAAADRLSAEFGYIPSTEPAFAPANDVEARILQQPESLSRT
jgi:DNA-binding IclR family transcriptional regulator